MSNFSFLRIENEYTQNDAYKKMVEYVFASEGYFYVLDTLCGQYARYAIEQYVEFINALYDIDYPYEPTQLKHYLYGENSRKLISKIGESTFVILWTINDLSKAYCHAGTPRSEEKYNQILPRLHDLMVDLYERVGGKRAARLEKFSYDKVESVSEIITPEGRKLKIVSAEEIESKVPDKEPESVKPMYEIKKQRGSIFLIDKDGKVLSRYVDYDKYKGTESEKKELEKKLNDAEKTYASIVQRMTGEIDGRDAKISGLQRKLKQYQQDGELDSVEIASLKQQIIQLNEEKRQIRTLADEQILKLQEMWLDADNKYHRLYISSAEEEERLKAEAGKLLLAREQIRKELLETEEQYNATISNLQKELDTVKAILDKDQHRTTDISPIKELEKKIKILEEEKKAYVVDFERRYAEVKVEIKHLLRNKEQQNLEWQNLVSQLIFENDYYKEVYIRRTKKEESEYLAVVQNSVSQINQETSLSLQNITEQMLRSYLLRVKKAYEEMLEDERRRADYWKNKYESEHVMPRVVLEEEEVEITDAKTDSDEDTTERVEEDIVASRHRVIGMRKRKRSFFGIVVAMTSMLCLILVLLIYFGTDRDTVHNGNISGQVALNDSSNSNGMHELENQGPSQETMNSGVDVEPEEKEPIDEEMNSEAVIETEDVSDQGDTETTENTEEKVDIKTDGDTEAKDDSESEKGSESEKDSESDGDNGPEGDAGVGNGGNQLPDGSIIQDALNRRHPPETWWELEGVNEALLEEIATINEKVLDYYELNPEWYNEQGYYHLGEFEIFKTYTNSSFGEWHQRNILQEDLFMNANHAYIKFFYYRTDYTTGFAILPEALSSEINAQTTIEELTELFAEEPIFMGELEAVTSFSTAEKEIGVVFDVNGENALFLFDENGVMCDYVYISARPYAILDDR